MSGVVREWRQEGRGAARLAAMCSGVYFSILRHSKSPKSAGSEHRKECQQAVRVSAPSGTRTTSRVPVPKRRCAEAYRSDTNFSDKQLSDAFPRQFCRWSHSPEAVQGYLFRAPSKSDCMQSRFPFIAAMCSGVLPALFGAFGSPPLRSRAFTMAALPHQDARCSGRFDEEDCVQLVTRISSSRMTYTESKYLNTIFPRSSEFDMFMKG